MQVVITPPEASRYEAEIADKLFEEGLHKLILRLPGKGVDKYVSFLEEVSSCHHHKIIISDHYGLLEDFDLGGIYVPSSKRHLPLPIIASQRIISTGIHSLDELSDLPFTPDFALLSPVFDSISKSGYLANAQLSQLKERLAAIPIPILAMGGVTSANIARCYEMGFDGIAVLGDIWEKKGWEISRFRAYPDTEILSLAGHDPCGGAGITADIRVAESLGVRCVTIPTTLTIQRKDLFTSSVATEENYIADNLSLNLAGNHIRIAKIGMVPSLRSLSLMIKEVKERGVKRIIWDPIISATAAERAVLAPDRCDEITDLMRSIYLITPNLPECKAWFGTVSEDELQNIVDDTGCHILLKGGHHVESSDKVYDLLIRPYQSPMTFTVARHGAPKHGTGCTLSSAIASYLALGHDLPKACQEAQRMVSRMMSSHSDLLPAVGLKLARRDKKRLLRYHKLQYITNTDDPRLLMKRCSAVLEGGGRWIQLRLKDSTTEQRTILGRRLRELCDQYDAVLIIDDDVEAVLRTGADGVHLGREDMSPLEARRLLGHGKIIGSTCNTSEDLLRAYHCGSDYVGVGPFRMTTTKKRLAPILGVEGVKSLAIFNHTLRHPMPMVAIGGITLEDVETIMDTGVSGIAVSGVVDISQDMSGICAGFITQIKKSDRGHAVV